MCERQKTHELQSAEAVERVERAEASIYVFGKKAHPQDDARERMVYLTLVSSCVHRRLGAELSTSSVDRRTTVGAR